MKLVSRVLFIAVIATATALPASRLTRRRPASRICDVSKDAIAMRDSVRAWVRDPASDFRRYHTHTFDSVGHAVPVKTSGRVVLVVDERVCARAAQELHGVAGPAALRLQPVAVVRTGNVYVVEDAKTLTHHSEDDYWEMVTFDKHWQRLQSWGGGA